MSETNNTDRLRKDIDEGRTADKAPGPDPAAAPLGSDAEAGGNPATHESIEMARHEEVEGRPTDPHPNASTEGTPGDLQGAAAQERTMNRSLVTLGIVAVVVIVLFLIF